MKGVHVVSPTVRLLPSLSPRRMAVIGRQRLKCTLLSQDAIIESAITMLTSANMRALSPLSGTSTSAIERNVLFQYWIALSAKKSAVSVCDGLRELPVSEPSALTSSYSSAYLPLVRCGGGSCRNWEASFSVNGSMLRMYAPAIGSG